jgi:hypothetical protein
MCCPPVLVVHVAKSALEPTYSSLLAAFETAGLESELLDTTKSLDDQFAGRKVVVDLGGGVARSTSRQARRQGSRCGRWLATDLTSSPWRPPWTRV